MTVSVEITEISLMRVRRPHEHHRVTYVELFFDLVFVYAITQISHTLLADLTATGLLHTTMLFLGVWWLWIFTSWITNWLDPERIPVRFLLFALMLAGLLLSTSIPQAFDGRGLAFALAYAGMQVGRTVFMFFAIPRDQKPLRRNFQRILVYLGCSAFCWIGGGLADSQVRVVCWAAALLIEYVGPYTNFWVPGLGASRVRDWSVEGGHMAERCACFIIIALGESIVVTGATFSELPWTFETVTAFTAAFLGSVAMWWIYFHKGAEAGAENISQASDPGRLARLSYTYLHMPIVAGIIVTAVGDELALKHPHGHSDLSTMLALVGGPLLFLIGTILFKRTIHGWFQLSHLAGIAALLALAACGAFVPPLWLSVATTLLLFAVAIWEAVSIGNRRTLVNKQLYRAQGVNGEHSTGIGP